MISGAQQLGEDHDSVEHRVRCDCANQPAELRIGRQALAPDHVIQEDRANGRPRRVGTEPADVRQDVVRWYGGDSGGVQQPAHLLLHSGIACDDHGYVDAGSGQGRRVVQQDARLSAVRTARQQQHVGRGVSKRLHASQVETPGRHVDDPCAGRQRCSMTRLGADLPLVPDDRQPQTTARAGTGQHQRVRLDPAEVLTYGADADHHIRLDGGPVLGGTE